MDSETSSLHLGDREEDEVSVVSYSISCPLTFFLPPSHPHPQPSPLTLSDTPTCTITCIYMYMYMYMLWVQVLINDAAHFSLWDLCWVVF